MRFLGYCRWSAELNLSGRSNMKNSKRTRVGSEAQYGPRLAGEILHNYLENSNEPLAVAYREHTSDAEAEDETDGLFKDFFPDTHLDVDLKLLTRKPCHLPVGAMLDGAITRDGVDHFCFIQNTFEKKKVDSRNSHVYKGLYINVNKSKDGKLYPTFRSPHYTKVFTFPNFCRKAAEELLAIAGFLEEN